MSFRNLSPQRMFEAMAAEHVPEFAFRAEDAASWRAWREEALPKVMECLGRFPPRCEPNPELLAEWEHDGLLKQKWLIDVQPGLAATLQVNQPEDVTNDAPRAAILCWHGHGPFGKDPVMGNDGSPDVRRSIALHKYDYGHQMAKAGFVTFAIDWMGCG